MKRYNFLRKWWGDDYFDNHEEFKADFDSVIADSIAESEAAKDHSLDYFIEDVNRMRRLFSSGHYTKSDEVKDKLANNMDDIQCLSFDEPTAYQERRDDGT
jgi:hypothetical protein